MSLRKLWDAGLATVRALLRKDGRIPPAPPEKPTPPSSEDVFGPGAKLKEEIWVELVRKAHLHSSYHRAELKRSALAGCFSCCSTFQPKRIREWIDGGATALCPNCGIDAVIGSDSGFNLNLMFLRVMHRQWFEPRAQ